MPYLGQARSHNRNSDILLVKENAAKLAIADLLHNIVHAEHHVLQEQGEVRKNSLRCIQ